jgi:hypothetical protein
MKLRFWRTRIALMSKVNSDSIQRLKKTAKEKLGKELSDNDVHEAITAFFDPTIPPPDIPQDQIDEIVESLLGKDSN